MTDPVPTPPPADPAQTDDPPASFWLKVAEAERARADEAEATLDRVRAVIDGPDSTDYTDFRRGYDRALAAVRKALTREDDGDG